MTLPEAPIRISLPPLHAGQLPVEKSQARFKVCICGRRFGKTTYGVRKCVEGALKNPGGEYWWIAPSYKVALPGWKMLKKLAGQIPETEIREADKQAVLKNGAVISIKSATDPDSLRGEGLSGAVFDEFSQIKEDTWYEVIRPALADRKGWALFIGTPKGKNWAYVLYQQAKVRPNWEAFRIPSAITEDGTAYTQVISTTNPYIDPQEFEDARSEMSAERFAQEILADFGASQYLVYPEVDAEYHEWRERVPEFIRYHCAMDFGGDSIGNHKSTAGIAGRTARDELIFIAAFEESGVNIAERQFTWAMERQQEIERVHRAAKMAPPEFRWRADKTQMVGIQFMRHSGLNIVPTLGGPDSVNEGIELVHRRLKLRNVDGTNLLMPRLFWLKGVPYIGEALMRYRYPDPRPEDKVQSKNPLKVNDDTADMIRYAVEDADRGPIGDPQELYYGELPRLS